METTEGRARLSPDLEVHLGYWLRRVSNQVSGEFRQALRDRGVSVAEWVAMCRIRDQPDVTPAALADSLALTRGGVSKVLEKLTAKSWIKRASVREDKRVQRLTLTSAGARALPGLAVIADENDERFFGCLDGDERAALRRLMEKLARIHGLEDAPID